MAKTETPSPDDEFVQAWRRLFALRREEIIAELYDTISREIGEMVDDPRLADLLEISVSENIVAAINFLEGGTSVNDLNATSGALAHARMMAQRDIPLASLFRAYHLGHAMFVRLGIDVIAGLDPAHHLALTQRLLDRSVDFIDKVCEDVGRAYGAEHDQWLGDRGGIRQYWVAQVLSDRTIDLGEAQAALGYRFANTHVGVQMWLPARTTGVDPRRAFEAARQQLVKALSPIAAPLMLPRDEREMHAWFPIRSDAVTTVADLGDVLEKSGGLQVELAIGRPELGADGFRRTSEQAKRVKEILMISAAPRPRAVSYDRLGPLALMTSDMEALRRFVNRVLGKLAKRGEREEALRGTLLAFLEHNRSYAATAQATVLHRNSVQNRVQRALELCELDLKDSNVALDIHTALTATHWLGRAVLDRG